MNQIPQDKNWPNSRSHPASRHAPDRNSILLVTLDACSPRAPLVEMLVSAGYIVSASSGSKLALNVLEAGDFDAVVLDSDFITASLEGICLGFGYAVPSVRVIVLGPRVGPTVKAHLLEAGADDYLEKPFDRRELIARIDSTLRRAAPDSLRHD